MTTLACDVPIKNVFGSKQMTGKNTTLKIGGAAMPSGSVKDHHPREFALSFCKDGTAKMC